MGTAARVLADPAGFVFLEVPAGARASALGGAYASIGEGVEAAFWNPAGLAAVHGIQVTASHYEFVEHLRHAQFGVAGALFGGGLAGTLRAMYSEPITERDAMGNEIGTFGAHDLEMSIGYGRALRQGLRVGATAQVIRERIAESAATAWSLGAGGSWDPEAWPNLRLSVSAHNLGPAASYNFDGARDVPLPAAVQAGLSYGIEGRGVRARGSLEARLTRGRPGVPMVGLELSQGVGAALRAGYRIHDDVVGFSMGAGYSFPALRLDYAFVPYRLELGDTHRLSLSAQF